MHRDNRGLSKMAALAALALCALASSALASPPPPPVLQGVPVTPLGGGEVSLATAACIAAYGIWKSRR